MAKQTTQLLSRPRHALRPLPTFPRSARTALFLRRQQVVDPQSPAGPPLSAERVHHQSGGVGHPRPRLPQHPAEFRGRDELAASHACRPAAAAAHIRPRVSRPGTTAASGSASTETASRPAPAVRTRHRTNAAGSGTCSITSSAVITGEARALRQQVLRHRDPVPTGPLTPHAPAPPSITSRRRIDPQYVEPVPRQRLRREAGAAADIQQPHALPARETAARYGSQSSRSAPGSSRAAAASARAGPTSATPER